MFRLPPLHDLVRFVRPTARQTADSLKSEYYRSGGIFNYHPSQVVARAVLSGRLSLQACLTVCERIGTDAGRASNAEVVRLLWNTYRDREYLCHAVPFKRRSYDLRRGYPVGVDLRFYVVDDGRPVLFVLQPRRAAGPTLSQFGLFAGILRKGFIKDDFETADIEIFDASIPPGLKQREARRYRLADLAVPTAEEIDSQIQMFVEAFDLLVKEGFSPPARPARKAPYVEAEKGLFDDLG